ncbi:costunolide synthase [Tanacetum coccineum]
MNASVSSIADRPITTTSQIFYYKAQDIGFSLPYWVQMRKICASELLTAERVRSYGYLQAEELENTRKSLESLAGTDTYKDQKELIELLNDMMNGLGDMDVVSYFPILQFLNGISAGKKGKWLKTHKQLDIILDDILEEHEKRKGQSRDHEALLDVLVRVKEAGELDVALCNETGMGTPTSVIEWAMSELMRNPKIMKKLQAEVRAVVKGKTVTDTDIQNPDSWENPDSFIPERFENSTPNYMGSDFQFIPFGAGRRICPGIPFGLNTVEHVNFLYHFYWKLPNGLKPQELDMTEVYGGK